MHDLLGTKLSYLKLTRSYLRSPLILPPKAFALSIALDDDSFKELLVYLSHTRKSCWNIRSNLYSPIDVQPLISKTSREICHYYYADWDGLFEFFSSFPSSIAYFSFANPSSYQSGANRYHLCKHRNIHFEYHPEKY